MKILLNVNFETFSGESDDGKGFSGWSAVGSARRHDRLVHLRLSRHRCQHGKTKKRFKTGLKQV